MQLLTASSTPLLVEASQINFPLFYKRGPTWPHLYILPCLFVAPHVLLLLVLRYSFCFVVIHVLLLFMFCLSLCFATPSVSLLLLFCYSFCFTIPFALLLHSVLLFFFLCFIIVQCFATPMCFITPLPTQVPFCPLLLR